MPKNLRVGQIKTFYAMRKLISLVLISMFAVLTLTAQEEKGKYSIDLNFNPAAIFDAQASSMFYFPQINGKYYYSSDVAIRLGLNIGLYSNKDYYDIDGEDYQKNSGSSFMLTPGIEKRYGSEKFFVFLGGELPIGTYSTKRVEKVGDNTTEYLNYNGGSFQIGLHGVLGCEYYFLPNAFVGVLFTPGYMFTKNKDEKEDGEVTVKGGSSSSFGLSSSSGLRIGFRF